MSLSLRQLFNLKCMINNISIRLCCRKESGVKQLLALVTDCGDVVLHYTYGELPAVIKRIPWFVECCKTIQAVCFDPTATWLLVVSLDGSLYIIPALSLVDNRQRIDCKWSLNDLTHFSKHSNTPDSKPLSLVWWQTLDSNQNALVGFKDGAIVLISLTDGRCLATCNVGDSVTRLYLCQDNSLDSVSLLINGDSGQQWRLILEQHSTSYIWPPEMNAIINETSASSRLQSLKQMSVDKLVLLKQRLTEGRGARRDSQTSDTASESSHSESSHSGPELLPHLCDTFFAPQYARNRYLFSAFYKPTSLLTVHAVDIESAPLYVHKLNANTQYLLLTNRLIYTVNDRLNRLSIVSSQLSECRLDGDAEFNYESLLAEFNFTHAEESIINIYKLSDTTSFNETKSKENLKKDKNLKSNVLPNSIEKLQLRKPKIDTCVVVTTHGVYKVILSCSLLKTFVTMATEESNLEKAEKLAIIFGLNLQELLESCGDLLISDGSFHQGLILYKQAKVHLLKRVLKLAVCGDSRALLKFIHLCLSASKVDMSTATKIHMGNLAVMAYTELILRHNGPLRLNTTRDFMNFLRFEEFYDQILAVNVACRSGHWNIVTLLGKARGLQPEIVAALGQVLQCPNVPNTKNRDFLIALSEPTLTQSLLLYPLFAPHIFSYIRNNIEELPTDILQRFARQLDPSQPSALPVTTRLFRERKVSASLDSTLDDSDCSDEMVRNTKDFIETFVWVVIQLNSKTSLNRFNVDLLESVEVSERPKMSRLLNDFPDIHPLSCGYEHAAVIRNGCVYTMGVANSGCLGFGPVLTQSSQPKLVHTLTELKLKILSVSCGRKHCLALTDFGVYSWGSNSHGQLGIGPSTQESPYPQLVPVLSDFIIVDVAAGQYHSVALTATGELFTWGWGIHGQLGHGNCDTEFYPKLLKFKHPISEIAAGHAHTLILTTGGALYGFGSNTFGQLETNSLDGNKVTTPVTISLLPDLHTPVKKIASAYFHNIAVREGEEVYTWGASPQEVRLSQSKYGQKLNGFGIKGHEPWKTSVHVFTGNESEPVDQVAVGFRHSAILHRGKLLLCKNMNGEMSPPKLHEQDNLGILNQRFLHVSCGPDFTIAMDHSGKLLAWGNNSMAQTLLGRPHDDAVKHCDSKVVMFKNTRRVIKIPYNLQSNSEPFPIEIPGLPTMAITFNVVDHKCLFARRNIEPHLVLSIENDLSLLSQNEVNTNRNLSFKNRCTLDQVVVDEPAFKFGPKTLHFVLERYSGCYDTESVLCRCLKVNNLQAASKIAFLNGHFSDSLGFQLAAFKMYMDTCDLDCSMFNFVPSSNGIIETANMNEIVVDSNKRADLFEVVRSNSIDKVNNHSPAYLLSSSSSLDSIQQWGEDLEDQGGRESPCNISQLGDIKQSMSQYVQAIKSDSPQISSVSRLISDKGARNKRDPIKSVVNDPKLEKVVEGARSLVEFYIKRTHSFENHILMQNILLKCIEFWLVNNLPVPVLESILLQHMEKYFYPLSILLFCKNFNNNLGEQIVDDQMKSQRPSGFLKEFSTKFCLQLCSMVLENVTKA